jgi:hypothetical protein
MNEGLKVLQKYQIKHIRCAGYFKIGEFGSAWLRLMHC